MDSMSPSMVGSPAMQGPVQPGAAPLPGATSGLFGSGGNWDVASTMKLGSAISTGFGGYAAYSAGSMASAQYNMQAKSYEIRADVVKLNAVEKSNFLRKQLLQDLSTGNANAAARGIDTGSNSVRRMQEESIGNVSRQIGKIKSGAVIESGNELTSAARSRAEGASVKSAAYFRTAGGLGKYALSQVL